MPVRFHHAGIGRHARIHGLADKLQPDFYGDSGGVLDVMGDTQNLRSWLCRMTPSLRATLFTSASFSWSEAYQRLVAGGQVLHAERFYPQFVVDTLCPDAGNPQGTVVTWPCPETAA